MAEISTSEVEFAAMPADDWGTAVALSGAQKVHGTYSITNSLGTFSPNGVGFDNFVTETIELDESCEITVTVDLRFSCVSMQLAAMVLGNDVVTEVTTDEGDFSHVIHLQNKNFGLFTTFVGSFGTLSGDTLEIPSVKWTGMNCKQTAPGVGTLTFKGLGDRLLLGGATNNLAALAACTFEDDDIPTWASLGGANHYFRANDSSDAALDSGDDKEIMNYEFDINRPMNGKRTLRGGLTRFIKEPLQQGATAGTLKVQLGRILASEWNLPSLRTNRTYQKVEIYQDGAAIGLGVNRSYKWRFPYAWPKDVTGFDAPNNNSEMLPTIEFDLHKRNAGAPTGQTGATNYAQLTAVGTRETAYV